MKATASDWLKALAFLPVGVIGFLSVVWFFELLRMLMEAQ